jgi:hypothetical protein
MPANLNDLHAADHAYVSLATVAHVLGTITTRVEPHDEELATCFGYLTLHLDNARKHLLAHDPTIAERNHAILQATAGSPNVEQLAARIRQVRA